MPVMSASDTPAPAMNRFMNAPVFDGFPSRSKASVILVEARGNRERFSCTNGLSHERGSNVSQARMGGMNRNTTSAAEFEALRGRLFGLGYRMLGSRADAEDIVQETYIRWHQAERSTIGN